MEAEREGVEVAEERRPENKLVANGVKSGQGEDRDGHVAERSLTGTSFVVERADDVKACRSTEINGDDDGEEVDN